MEEKEEGAKEVEKGGSNSAEKGATVWTFCGPREELKKEFEKSFFSFSSVKKKVEEKIKEKNTKQKFKKDFIMNSLTI